MEHPDEELLERFLLGPVEFEELEALEEHILVCPQCVEMLESLELTVAATRLVLSRSEKSSKRTLMLVS